MPDEVVLLADELTKDGIGQLLPDSQEQTPILCTVREIKRDEWRVAYQSGIEPEAVLEVFSGDYSGEKKALFRGRVYLIYRAYQPGEYTELYLGTRVGVVNGA